MRSVNQILRKKVILRIVVISLLSVTYVNFLEAQDNSPYSRYGLGDQQPNMHTYLRSMGGISAAFSEQPIESLSDPRNGKYYAFINYSNPASYSRFYAIKEDRTKKLRYGRMLLDVGVNFDSHKLKESDQPQSFTSSNAYFSYLQLGVPIKRNWGFVFGLRPLTSISYKIDKNERLVDPNNGPFDSVRTRFEGDGGSYLFNLGTGFAIRNLSIGINAGYLFGQKNYSTRRSNFPTDTVAYNPSNHQTKTNYGGIFFNAGIQYRIDLNSDKTKYLQFGAFGNMQNKLDSRSDIIRETYYISGTDGGEVTLDSVYKVTDIKGKINYPSGYGLGFIAEQLPNTDRSGWLVGMDYVANDWDKYSFNGIKDAVASNWQFKFGGQIRPRLKESYKSLLAYRAGFFVGEDYISINNEKLPVWGITGGLSLPIANLKDASRRFRTQYSVINLALEYIRRGNNDNFIKDSGVRLSVGFTLSDLWFTKRKYD